jgi:Predicted metal-dependent enzyme
MTYWKQYLKLVAATLLLPALESGEETLVGGQAVFEGVMMRTPHAWGIAVRKPSGEMVSHSEALARPSEKHKWMAWPVVRGVITLGHAMMLGFRALKFSANVALAEMTGTQDTANPSEKVEISGWMATVNILFSLGFFILFYKFLPLLAATGLKHSFPSLNNRVLFNLVDGAIRIGLFLLFVWGISLARDIHRVYEYHGAEHKTVFAFETGEPVDVPRAQSFVTWHPRCGTSFLMTVMLICIVVYSIFPVQTFWGKFALRLIALPFIAGISYELIRYAARKRNSLFALLTLPGLWLQRITTQPPADEQVECAIRALDCALEVEKQNGGELVIA